MTGEVQDFAHAFLKDGMGADEVAIGVREGKAILWFPKPCEWIALEPTVAAEVAKSLLDCAVECGARISIQTPKVKVPNEIRKRMQARALMILTNKRESPERDPILAERLVDTLLNMLDL